MSKRKSEQTNERTSEQVNERKGERSLLTVGRVELTRTYSSLLHVTCVGLQENQSKESFYE